MHRLPPPRPEREPLRAASAKMGPLRNGAHLALGSGRIPTLADWRRATRLGSGPHARGVRVFAVEPTSIQLDWAALGPGQVTFRCADTTVTLITDGGAGAVTLDDLPSGRTLDVEVSGNGVPMNASTRGRIDFVVTTPHPPPGEEVARIATFSDSHVGESTFGYLHTIGEARSISPDNAHSLRAVRAATTAALAWGATRIVAKGDIVDQSHPEHWAKTLAILEDLPVPVHLIPGNHEVKKRRSIEPRDALRGSSVSFTDRVDHVDLHGASLILVNSSVPDHERGQLRPLLGDLQDALTEARWGCLITLHHHLRSGTASSAWPVGVPRDEAEEALEMIARVHPHSMVTSGHVHRNRLRFHGEIPVSCVGSVKDYPGVWAGYVFNEGGMRQVIRRVAEPSVISWTDRTGDTMGGLYRHWTPSTLAKRCVSVSWATRPR